MSDLSNNQLPQQLHLPPSTIAPPDQGSMASDAPHSSPGFGQQIFCGGWSSGEDGKTHALAPETASIARGRRPRKACKNKKHAPAPGLAPIGRKRRRLGMRMACHLCREMKLRCEEAEPCSECIDRGVECKRDEKKVEKSEALQHIMEVSDHITALAASMDDRLTAAVASMDKRLTAAVASMDKRLSALEYKWSSFAE